MLKDQLGQKLAILAGAAKYDVSCSSSGSVRSGKSGMVGNATAMGVCHSFTPDGRCIALLKILLTNFCIYDCRYCVNRVSSDVPRARFTPEEVAHLTMAFYRRNYVEGLFLSSGVIKSPDSTMEQLARVGQLLREHYRFNGYIHLKAVPGASPALITLAGRYADRLSANIELPTQVDLSQLAPQKRLDVITGTMSEIKYQMDDDAQNRPRGADKRKAAFAPAGQSTQMIVGATPTPDGTILQTASGLYNQFRLKRVYYSAFSPIGPATGLPTADPPLLREHRLYQADWLLRFYGFKAQEIVSQANENLDLQVDPKTGWALRNRAFFPVDINKDSRETLLRVPGMGVRNVERILHMRRWKKITLEDLMKLRVVMKRVRPFVITHDWHPDTVLLDSDRLADMMRPPQKQLSLFQTAQEAVTGEL